MTTERHKNLVKDAASEERKCHYRMKIDLQIDGNG